MPALKGCPRCYGMYPDTPSEWDTNGYCCGCQSKYMRSWYAVVKQSRRGQNKVFLASRQRLSLDDYVDLRMALRRMPITAQRVLILWAAGYTFVEIAAQVGVSDEWVSRLMYKYAPTWRLHHVFVAHKTTEKMRQEAQKIGKRYIHITQAERWKKYHPELCEGVNRDGRESCKRRV